MPNTAIAVGKSMTCICSNENGEKTLEKVKKIFNSLGHTLACYAYLRRCVSFIITQ